MRIHIAFEGERRRRCCSLLSTSTAIAAAAVASTSSSPLLVKVCGVTHPDDAALAAAAGADLVGVIMWPKAKRAVSASQAREIGEAARRAARLEKESRRRKRTPALVGVFVDETAAEISRAAAEADLDYVQLHGDGARQALVELLEIRARREKEEEGKRPFGVVFVLTVGIDGVPTSLTPQQLVDSAEDAGKSENFDPRPDLLLVDGPAPGSGEAWDWGGFVDQQKSNATVFSTREGTWLLAGGLCPDNVAGAIVALKPGGVDVSSGVCGPDGLRKDGRRITSFVEAAREGGTKH